MIIYREFSVHIMGWKRSNSQMTQEFLNKVLKDIKQFTHLTWFFQRLWKPNSIVAKLFFVHRAQIFPTEESVTVPLIFWDNFGEGLLQLQDTAIVEAAVELESIKGAQLSTKIQTIFADLIKQYKDLISYFGIELIRQNKQLRKLVTDEEFSYQIMKRTLGKHKTLDLAPFGQLNENRFIDDETNVDEIGDPVVKSQFNQMFEKGMDTFIRNFSEITPGFIRVLSTFSAFLIPSIIERHKSMINLFEAQGFNSQEYTRILSDLYTAGIIKNVTAIMWCRSCRDSPQIYHSTSQFSPDHLKMSCLNCGRMMDIGAIYSVDKTIRDCILSQDGLLSVAVAWFLDQEGLTYEYSQKGVSEYDFICQTPRGTVLIECKMFRTDKAETAVIANLGKSIEQMIRHIKELQAADVNLVESYLVCNFDSNTIQASWEELNQKQTIRDKILTNNIEIISYENIPELLKSFK